MKKVIAFLGGIFGLLSLLSSIPGLEFFAWWTFKSTNTLTHVTSTFYIDAFGYSREVGKDPEFLNFGYTAAGIFAIVGMLLIFAASIKEKSAVVVIGGIMCIIGPIVFILAHLNNEDFNFIADLIDADS
ncbi:MAG: hypothetical protein ACTSVI_16055, partial [Promethearchaeota archaeon]